MQKTNRYNPLAVSDTESIANLIVGMMPKSKPMTKEESLQLEKERSESEAHYRESRLAPLPADTYRILDQGGFMGWHYELEIDGQKVVLQEPGQDFCSAYAVHENSIRADELARVEIARCYGEEAAKRASFHVVWGGTL